MITTFDVNTDYKTQFIAEVDTLVLTPIYPREERILAVNALINIYVRDIGEVPDSRQLERLSDALLHEELTDPDPHKSAHSEYPILSEIQMERRRNGSRESRWPSNMRGEASLYADSSHGTDGRNHRSPTRRKRTRRENYFVDATAIIHNKARAAQYRKDTDAGELVTYNLRATGGELAAEFTASVGLAQRWRDSLSAVYECQ